MLPEKKERKGKEFPVPSFLGASPAGLPIAAGHKGEEKAKKLPAN